MLTPDELRAEADRLIVFNARSGKIKTRQKKLLECVNDGQATKTAAAGDARGAEPQRP